MQELTSENVRPGEPNRELDDLRGRIEAVSDILRALSRSAMRLQPILDQIVEAAARLGRADSCLVWLVDGEQLRLGASYGAPTDAVEYQRSHPHTAEPGSCTGRVALTKGPVHIPDVDTDPGYTYAGTPRHYRTLLGLPILVEEDLVGVFGLSRREVRPFETDEIDLMATFADQSAIAISSARLFETVERQKAEIARFVSPEVAELVSSEQGRQLLSGHRAYITIAYFDLRGFTAFVETAEPEELIEVIGDYHAAAGELVRAHGGMVEHFAGDGLMVFFNDPVPVANPELQAARLALAMRERIGELAAGWRKRGYELELGAGIAVGHATLGRIGFEGRYDYGALGSVTNLAARLSDKATAGQILLSQRAHAALEDWAETTPVGGLDVKGFARSVQAFELIRLRDTSAG
ncbi:MAG TPA: adenylate/guanylate cyclase domain-containing protein [Gaiellaceae bacterium]|nr:adenylate/guanylate cyclase domain-containing protein [Gaiellaceae bacterium]